MTNPIQADLESAGPIDDSVVKALRVMGKAHRKAHHARLTAERKLGWAIVAAVIGWALVLALVADRWRW